MNASLLLCRAARPIAARNVSARLPSKGGCNTILALCQRPSAHPTRSLFNLVSLSRRNNPPDGHVRASLSPKNAIAPIQHVRALASSQQPPNEKPPSDDQPQAKVPLTARIKSLATPHENIWTIPNILTFSRLFASPVIGYLILHDQHAWAIGLFAYAGITDLVDGWIARRFKQQTVVGTVIDPMADKTLMTILTVTLAVKGALPGWCATIIIGRDVLLAISAIYYRWISLPPPKTFARYWDFSLPSAEVHPTGISKINTALQLGLIGWTVCMPMLVGYGDWIPMALTGFQYLVATTTVWSGLSYVYNKDAVKILSKEDIEQRQRQAKDDDK